MNIQHLIKPKGQRMTTKQYSLRFKQKSQAGAVLVVSLIMLLLLTIIGVSSVQTTTLEERMAGNMRNKSIAFQNAEAALRAGENYLANLSGNFTAGAGRYLATGTPPGANDDWSKFSTVTYNAASTQASAAPMYVIQLLPTNLSAGTNPIYRITARGVGGTDSAVAVVQSIYQP